MVDVTVHLTLQSSWTAPSSLCWEVQEITSKRETMHFTIEQDGKKTIYECGDVKFAGGRPTIKMVEIIPDR